jgi:type IV secretory pathway VirB10-like protein
MKRRITTTVSVAIAAIAIIILAGSYFVKTVGNLNLGTWFARPTPVFEEATGENTSLADRAAAAAAASGSTPGTRPAAQTTNQSGTTRAQTPIKAQPDSEPATPSLSDEQLALIEAIRLETLQAEAEERQHRRQRLRMAGEAPLGNSLYSLTPQSMASLDGAATTASEPQTGQGGSEPASSAQLASNPTLQSLLSRQPYAPPVQATLPAQPPLLPSRPNAAPVQNTSLQELPPRAVQPTGTQALERGTFISAAMLTELRSELPGLVRAMVTDAVYDSHTGHFEMIPAGALLIGRYNTQTAPGQSRLLVAWDELQFPDGRIVSLDRQGAVDAQGASGITGKRQTGFLTTVLTGALVNMAANAGRSQTPSTGLSSLAGQALGQSVSNATQDYMSARLAQGPRFTIKSGEIVNVLLDTPLYLKGRRVY